MNEEYEVDLLTLLDDDGNEHEFEILDEIDNDEGHFVALSPTAKTQSDFAVEPDTYYIFEIVDEDGEEQLMEVQDDAMLDKLAEIFESRFDEEYYGDEEDSEE